LFAGAGGSSFFQPIDFFVDPDHHVEWQPERQCSSDFSLVKLYHLLSLGSLQEKWATHVVAQQDISNCLYFSAVCCFQSLSLAMVDGRG
jgi:hypothetical protein